MSTPQEEIRTLVYEVVSPLIDEPEKLEVNASDENGNLLIEISVDESDAGKVIGRQGRVIKSIRTLARAAASRKDLTVDVELVD